MEKLWRSQFKEISISTRKNHCNALIVSDFSRNEETVSSWRTSTVKGMGDKNPNKPAVICRFLRIFASVMEKTYEPTPVTWLRVTDFMHGWIQRELGGGATIREKKVVTVQHLDGARDVLCMETTDNTALAATDVGTVMSAALRNAIDAGMRYDAAAVEREYGLTKDALGLYVPIECPKNAVTEDGVLRPWSQDTCFTHKQAVSMQRLLREAFWQAVSDYAQEYALQHRGEKYAQQDMIEAFCQANGTDDIHVPAIRREWQRRVKRKAPDAK